MPGGKEEDQIWPLAVRMLAGFHAWMFGIPAQDSVCLLFEAQL